MKSIKQQYIDLTEGKMSQANFMRNLRMTMPQYVTNVTSFNDAVRILKNKSILSESYEGNDAWIENFESAVKNWIERWRSYSYDEKKAIEDALSNASADELIAKYDGMTPDEAVNDFVGDALASSRHYDDYDPDNDQSLHIDDDSDYEEFKEGKKLNEAPLTVKGKVVKTYKQNGDKSYSVEYDDGSQDKIYVSHDDWDKINALHNQASSLSEAKKTKLTADQVNNDELRMGIRVEMEHTNDPEKAKKIALDHLAENPFYYTQLKLSGVDTKALPSKEKQAIAKKKDETEVVDKKNQMKTPKGVEKIKASANKAKKETNKPEKGIKMMSLVSKTSRGVKKMDATGEKMKKIKENLESMYDAAEELAQQMGDYDSAVVALQDEMGLSSQVANDIASKIYPSNDFKVARTIFSKNRGISSGINKIAGIEEKLREAIRKMIKQETFDGRDNMTDVTGENN